MADKRAENVALIRRGFIPFGKKQDQELPQGVLNQIEGFSPDIFDGGGESLTEAPMGAGAPSGGGQIVTIGGQQYRAPAAALKKTEKAGTVKFSDPSGEYTLPVSPEAARELLTKRLASPEGEQDPYADIDEAYKTLKKLRLGKNEDFNLERLPDGTVKVVPDKNFSWGYSAAEIKKDLELERKNREQILKESKAESETMPDSAAGIKQGTNRVPSISPNRVTDVRLIPNLPRIGRGTNAPAATTNAPPQVRLPVDSLAPASSMSSESLSELDLDELRQAMLEAQSNGMDPAVLGLQLRQALNQSGVPTAAGTNSLPLGLSQEQFDAILRMPRGRAPVEL
jgi:hypothetical protein